MERLTKDAEEIFKRGEWLEKEYGARGEMERFSKLVPYIENIHFVLNKIEERSADRFLFALHGKPDEESYALRDELQSSIHAAHNALGTPKHEATILPFNRPRGS